MHLPISLLSSLGKLFEKIIKEKIWDYLDKYNIIPKEQFGFRPNHSTTQQIKRLTKYIKEELETKKSTAMVLLDVEKAFDTVWHKGLICKFINIGFPHYIINIVQSFLTDRWFCLSINSNLSDMYKVEAGVPQGSVLGPLLYIIFCSDIPRVFDCNYAFYADDTALFCSGVDPGSILENLQSALNSLSIYYNKWKIKVNAGKSQAIFFTRKRSPCKLPDRCLSMNFNDIPWSNNVKYLGVILDKRLIFSDHVKHVITKFNIAIKIVYPLINRKSKLCTSNKIILVKSIFQSILLYACPTWGICSKTHIKKLQICQNKLLKMIMNLPWHYSTSRLHSLCNVDFINDRIRKITDNFTSNCLASENTLVSSLYT